ncbi:MAG: DUF2278 family protein, partial [Acetobacteraceae bacterium]|nr:DUF2278 family protein [Acetobacteraceae bacterium]
MTLSYGFVKAKVSSQPVMRGSRRRSETQYHLHFSLLVDGGNWDVAVNVGTNDSDDLLKYKLVFDFRHQLTGMLSAAAAGQNDLTGQSEVPALDFMRSDVLAGTGDWRDSDIMDGTDTQEPAASLSRLLQRAWSDK